MSHIHIVRSGLKLTSSVCFPLPLKPPLCIIHASPLTTCHWTTHDLLLVASPCYLPLCLCCHLPLHHVLTAVLICAICQLPSHNMIPTILPHTICHLTLCQLPFRPMPFAVSPYAICCLTLCHLPLNLPLRTMLQ